MKTSSLQTLLKRRDIWQGRPRQPEYMPGRPTGHAELDATLHHGGWPEDGLIELLCAGPCPAAPRLMLPALARCESGHVLFANAPFPPFAPALRAAGVDTSRLLLVHGRNEQNLLRAVREAAVSRAVAALLLWLPAGRTDMNLLRRLHRAARQGQCLLVLIHPERGAESCSPAPLRMRLHNTAHGELALHIYKQPGRRGGQRLCLQLLPEFLHNPPAAVARMAPPRTMNPVCRPPESFALPDRLPPPPAARVDTRPSTLPVHALHDFPERPRFRAPDRLPPMTTDAPLDERPSRRTLPVEMAGDE